MQNNNFLRLFVGQNLVKLSTTASTNSYLKELLSKSEPLSEGTVILADDQFAGRGQTGNSWFSSPGQNLTFSLLLNPRFLSVQQQFDLNKAISLALWDVLSPVLGPELKIKWPNDILFRDKKIAGILIENIIQGSSWKHAIIGIGLNVNQTDFPSELAQANSIKKILQRDCDLNRLLDDLCKAIEVRYLSLKAGKHELLKQQYLQALYRFEEQANFKVQGDLKSGKITGIGPNGLLQVYMDGELKEFGFKEIAFILD
ncbi:MAG: hypothetical protein RI924_164 [Bacteroidota bacterium]|jgi:BirA family biotin operon repressor/biotin-[acetyl-CoA-carboxylase] ligase